MSFMGKEKIIKIILLCIMFIPTLVFSFDFTSFLYPKEIVLSIFLILLLPFFIKNKEELSVPIHLVLFFVLNLYLFLSCLYAKVPEQTLVRSAELFLVFITVVLITDFNRDGKYDTVIEYGILLSGLVVALALIVQYFDLLPVLFPKFSFYKQLYSVFGNQNLAGTYIAIVMISALFYWDNISMRDIFKSVCFFILVYGLILSNSRSSWLSVSVIMVFYFINRYKEDMRHGRKNIYVLVAMLLGILLTLPFIYERLKYSFTDIDIGFRVRLWLYDGSIRMFLSHPFFGVGFGNFYFWSPKYLADALNSSYGSLHISNELLTLHAHNDILELLAETGIIGFFIVGLFYFSPIFIYRRPYIWWAFIFVSFLNPIFISSSHLIVACLSIYKEEQIIFKEKNIQIEKLWNVKNKSRIILSTLGFLSIVFLTYTLWIPDYKLRQAERLLILGYDCESQYKDLVSSKFATYAMYEGYVQELMRKKDYHNAYKVLKEALNKTDGGNIYLLLGRCAEELGKKEESIKWYRECLYRFPNNKTAREYLLFTGDLK